LQSGNMTTESRKSPTFRRTMRRLTLSSLSGTPELSETNLYDAIIFTLGQMRPVSGRKAIVLISSGIDTLSKAGYDDLLRTAENSDTPIYVVSLAPVLSPFVEMEHATLLARIDWNKAQNQLQEMARASAGRAYAPENMIDLSATYDDRMENLKVRYVITYRSSSDGDLSIPRTVRVELVNPSNGEPLEIVDSNGKTI
jgi:Ca-activated chloride channel family protein